MSDVMRGVRILEVAEHTFVPAASAILADWGAEVIKIEHVERGDAMRGLASSGVMSMGGDVHVLLEHSNRGKKSIGVDLTTEKGVELVYKLAATCDVFLTNKLPGVRKRLRMEFEDIRAQNPDIIYVAGTGEGSGAPTPTGVATTSSATGAGRPAPWAAPLPTPRASPCSPPPGTATPSGA